MGVFGFLKADMKNIIEEISKGTQAISSNLIESQKPKPVRHKKSFLLESITNLAHSYLKNLCISSRVEPISKSEIKESLQSLRIGSFNIDDYINWLKQWQGMSLETQRISSFIIQTIEEEFIKKAEAKLQDKKSQIKLKENALKEASLLYDLQMAKIQAILNKIKD